VEEPDNAETVDYMKTHLQLLTAPPVVMAVDPSEFDPEDFSDIRAVGGEI